MDPALVEQLFPGIWRCRLGEPEPVTAVGERHRPPDARGLDALSAPEGLPKCGVPQGRVTPRGCLVRFELGEEEQLYGLGLQLLSHAQRGRKKTLRVNSDPRADLGDSHAPVPFYVSTAGYGVLVDTARYATFYLGSADPVDDQEERAVWVEIPVARGVDVYLFAGPTPLAAVQRYNLFSGGGCLPPRWGLGVLYRCRKDFSQEQVLAIAESFRSDRMPCDVIGLEPEWQTRCYPCTYVWNDTFPDPEAMISRLAEQGFRCNLWTHAFVHPESPLNDPLRSCSGTFRTFSGLVPDMAQPEVRQILAEQHGREHVDRGVSGYKLDECDNSDYIHTPWSFPEISQFPSELDGEQMHVLLGRYYQETIDGLFRERDTRTLGQVRSSGALAAPYPFVLYSDLYNHKEYIRGVVNCGFSGLLWTPEVRHARSDEDLIRRLQSVVLSPQVSINGWYIKHPPWKQWERQANNDDDLHPDRERVEGICRDWLRLRMQLVPYLYSAFFRYWREGVPPFRALVLDWPGDPQVREIDDQYLIGDRLMAAPVVAGQTVREVYLPEGAWYDFWTGECCEGGASIEVDVPLERAPLYVRGGAVLPMAEPTSHAGDKAAWDLTVQVYGDGAQGIALVEDDTTSFAFARGEYALVSLYWDAEAQHGRAERRGSLSGPRYRVLGWRVVGA